MDDRSTKKIVIVGGGIIGCLVAMQFRARKYDVTIIEQKNGLGGILRDYELQNDFFLRGCQYLENGTQWIDDLKAFSKERFFEFKYNYASSNTFDAENICKENLAVPAFKVRNLLEEQFSYNQLKKNSLYDRLNFYPNNINKKLISFLKNCNIEPREIHSTCADNLQISRVNILNFEDTLIKLKKKNKSFDHTLAVPRNVINKKDLFYSFPENGYSKLFENISKKFEKIGIKIILKSKADPIWQKNKLALKLKDKIIKNSLIFWSGNPTNLIFQYNKKKLNSNVFKTFQINANVETDDKKIFFLQNFSDKSKILRIHKYTLNNKNKIGVECIQTNQNFNSILKEAVKILKNFNINLIINNSLAAKYPLPRFDIFTVQDQKLIFDFQKKTEDTNLLFSPWLVYGRKNKIEKINEFLNRKKIFN